MKANARHEPGSTRSRRTALSRSASSIRRFPSPSKSTYKTQTKCIQNRKCDFFSVYASMTYNFNAVKCLNSLARPSALLVDNTKSAIQTHGIRMPLRVESYSFSLGEKVRMRDRLVPPVRLLPWQLAFPPLYTMRNNETIPKTQCPHPLRLRHLQHHRSRPSHFQLCSRRGNESHFKESDYILSIKGGGAYHFRNLISGHSEFCPFVL
jgi:hypothetical protein